MGVVILCPLLAIVFAGWIDPGSALKPPQNVVKDLLNLDLSLYWEQPDDASNFTTYTVAFREKKTWRSIPHCVNITKTECTNITNFLIAESETDTREILTKSYYLITRLEQPSSVEKSSSASVTVEVFPYTDATISAPDIEILKITADSTEVALLAPETMYYDGETQQFFRMDDNKLRGFSKVNYNYTLWRISGDGQDANKVYEASFDDNSKVVSLSQLTPYTVYTLAVSARIGEKRYSKDNSTLIFRTKEAAPSRSPTLLAPFDEELDCKKLNSRDVQIKWKAPAKEYWNGRNIYYEVRLHRIKDGDENVTSIAVMNASSTSRTVHDLSRLDDYDIVVYANTSDGGIPSSHISLPGADREKAGFKPQDLHQRDSFWPTKIIKWKPPSGYEECTFEYRVIVESDGQTARKTDVKNATFLDISYLEPGSYVVNVSVITKGRHYLSDYGLPASLQLNVPQSKIHQKIIPVSVTVGLLAFLLLVLSICYAVKSQHSSMPFRSLDPFLRKAFSRTYSPTRYCDVEKEMFDTPRNLQKLQGHEAVASEETSLSIDEESTNEDSIVTGIAHDEAAGSHGDDDDLVSNQPLKPLHTPPDVDDDTDDDQDAERQALMQQYTEPSRSAGEETKPESTSSRSADIVPPSGDKNKPSKPSAIKRPQHESNEKSLPLIKISKASFDSTPSSPNGTDLGYTILANLFALKY